MDVVLNKLLWSVEYQEETFIIDMHTGRVVHGTNPGPQLYLNKPEEPVLREFVIVVGQIGYGSPKDKLGTLPKQLLVTKEIYRKKKLRWMASMLSQEATLSFSAK